MNTRGALKQEAWESIKLRWVLGAVGGGALGVALVAWQERTWEIMGWQSLTTFLVIASALATFVVFPVGFNRNWRLPELAISRWRQGANSLVLALAYAMFSGAVALLVGVFIANAFKGIVLDPFAVTVLTTVAVGLASYSSMTIASRLESMGITQTMVAFLVMGICSSMILNDNHEWWRHNFSYLGDMTTNTFLLFSFTLIVSGILLLVIIDYIMDGLSHDPQRQSLSSHHQLLWFRLLFTGIALSMVLLGSFPNVVGQPLGLLHNVSARIMLILVMTLILSIPWTLPGLSKTFYTISYLFAVWLVAMYTVLYWWLAYFNLTSFELFSFFTCIAWLYLLLQTISARVDDTVISEEG